MKLKRAVIAGNSDFTSAVCFYAFFFKCSDTLINILQAEEFSSRIQKLTNQGSTSDREATGSGIWMS